MTNGWQMDDKCMINGWKMDDCHRVSPTLGNQSGRDRGVATAGVENFKLPG